MINFNIITRNYCLNQTTLIFAVAFLLSDSIVSYGVGSESVITLCIENDVPLVN